MSQSTQRRHWWQWSGRSATSPQAKGLRSTPVRLAVERLESRDLPANTISGTVVQTVNVAGLFPEPTSSLFGPVQGVTVLLDNAAPQVTGTDGTYAFANVSAGTHTVSLLLPAGFLGFTAQSLSYSLNLAAGEDFDNLNFALTPKNAAAVQNLYELVLHRPADLNGFTTQVDALTRDGSVGGVFRALYRSAEFREVVRPVATFLEAFFQGPVPIGLLRHSVELMNLGITPDAAILDSLYSHQFIARHGDTSQLSDRDYVKFMYAQLTTRQPSQQALRRFVGELGGGTNRGRVALEIIGDMTFRRHLAIQRRIGVSLAFLGVLGREATAAEVQRFHRNGGTLRQLANKLARSAECRALKGYTDTFYWDVLAQASKPAVDVLSRLQRYNPATQAFDLPVSANSITSTTANAKNVYVFAHGWSPGLTEPVLLGSTPGNPLKSWETADSNHPDPAYLYGPTNQISAEGLAQAIIDADPRAVVLAYSWLELSATVLGNDVVTPFTLPATATSGSDTITVDASRLGAGMSVTGPNIPAGTTVSFLLSQTSVKLSNKVTASLTDTPLTFSGPNLAKGIEQFLYAGQSESRTQWSGLMLAEAIHQSLAPGFFPGQGLLHLLGHSHGSKVATVATLALQQANVPVSHLTLFESPEAGPTFLSQSQHASGLGGAENFNWYYLQQMNLSKTPITGTRLPSGGTFVDNYFAQEGFGSALGTFPNLGDIVDIRLHPEDLYGNLSFSNPQQDAADLFGSHDYPPPWYGQASLQNPNGPANTLNGLSWSPLINPATTAALGSFYEQQHQSTPGQFVQTQFELNAASPLAATTPTFSPLQYAQQSAVGHVADNGSSITLSVDAANTQAIETITFEPLGTTQNGSGMDFQFTFTGVDPGEDVTLVIWIHGMASVLQTALTQPLGNTLGFISIPLFTMEGLDAGSSPQNATLSLDGYRLGVLLGSFNAVVDVSSGNPTPIVPILGLSLVTADGSTASVTVTNLRQFSDGIS